MQFDNLFKEKPWDIINIIYFVIWYKISHFTKIVYYQKDRIYTPLDY